MTGIIPIRLNDDILQKIKTNSVKENVGHSTYCKNIVAAFMNDEFCRKNDYNKIKYELNAAHNNLKILQIELINKNTELQKYKAAQENQTYIPNKNREKSLPNMLYALWQDFK